MTRRALLAGLLVAALAAVAALGAANPPANPSALPTGLAAGGAAESSALYCTGLTSASGAAAGRVVFLNTTATRRDIEVSVASDSGHRGSETIPVGPHATATVSPASLAAGATYGVSAVVDGGGVVADEVVAGGRAEAPCATDGVTQWYGSGFDSTVGSSAWLSFYNPTATPAVVNVTAYTPAGFVAPAPFQGLAVAAHAEATIDLGRAIVNVSDFGARVNVVRGALVIAGVEHSLTVGSIDGGAGAPATTDVFPAVTTAASALAQIRLADPGPVGARVTLSVSLGGFEVPAITLDVPAYGEARAVITPNSSIPAAGLAVVRVSSSEPVVASLAAGTAAGVALTPAAAPTGLALLGGFDPAYDAVVLVNSSDRPVWVSVERTFAVAGCGSGSGPIASLGSVRVAAGAAVAATSLPGVDTTSCAAALVSAPRPVLVVAAVLPTTPAGVALVSASAG